MKKIASFLLAALPFAVSAQADKSFEIKGSLKNIPLQVQKVFIRYQSNGNNITDSLTLTGTKYSFTGSIAEPVLARLSVKYADTAGKPVKLAGKRDYATVFLSPGKINISSVDSFSNIKVTGSKAHNEYVKITASLKPITELQNALYDEYSAAVKAKDEVKRKAIEDKIDATEPDIKKVYGEYVKNNPSSPLALYAINQFAGWDIDAAAVEPYFAALPSEVRASASGKNLANRLEIARKTAIGQPALEFVQNDTLGVPVSLSSLKGKYILVDFWASWCGPCRRENPNVVKAFNQFKEKGFSILSVSLDQPGAKDKWIEAIHKDNLTWTHVSDLKYWDNEVAKQYGIRAIPQNFLVDPQGTIVAKNLNGENLEKKLAEFINK